VIVSGDRRVIVRFDVRCLLVLRLQCARLLLEGRDAQLEKAVEVLKRELQQRRGMLETQAG